MRGLIDAATTYVHTFMQPTDAVTASAHEQERQQCMHQTCDAAGNHLETKTGGRAQEGPIGLVASDRGLGRRIDGRIAQRLQRREAPDGKVGRLVCRRPARRNNVARFRQFSASRSPWTASTAASWSYYSKTALSPLPRLPSASACPKLRAGGEFSACRRPASSPAPWHWSIPRR